MILLNYTHPLTAEQCARLADLLGSAPEVRRIAVQIDQARPLAEQIAALVDAAGLSPDAWQTTPVLVNLPGFAPAAAALLAELHGRIGSFPTIVRLRPLVGSTPTAYEVAELLNLQTLREQARLRRRDSAQ